MQRTVLKEVPTGVYLYVHSIVVVNEVQLMPT